jgi:DNA-binding transcriptional LysR family regulator
VGLDPDSRFHPLRRQRQLSDPRPGCIGEGVGDRSGSRTPCGFAGTEKRLPRAIAATAGRCSRSPCSPDTAWCLPIYLVGDLLQSGRLVTVLDDYTPPLTLRALYSHDRHLSAKVRAFVDFLAARFGREPPWDSWCRSPANSLRCPLLTEGR